MILNDLTMEVYPGQIIGYIGPNGSGKSTTTRILAGLDQDFSGEVTVAGIDVMADPIAVKKRIGYVPENAALYESLSPREFLQLIGALHGMSSEQVDQRAERMLDFLDLAGKYDESIDTFSKGMRQKVLLTAGLLHNPEIIFLDEPLSGLDANAVILVKEIISQLAKEGKTIFYCSHMMDVVEKIADRILLINDGRIIADGSFEDLKREGGETLESLFAQLTGDEGASERASGFLESIQGE